MLTPLTTKDEDETKISSEYYSTHYTPPQQHYYYHHHHQPVSFTDESNNLHHHHPQTPNLYDPTQYYTLSPGYAQTNLRITEEDSNPIYMPLYHHRHHYSPEEILFTSKTSEQQSSSIYDYTLSPNQIFHQHTNYAQTPVEQTPCSTSNGGDYLTPYVNEIRLNENKFFLSILVTIKWSVSIGYNYR